MKEKQAIPFQVAPQMIEMDVQRNVHQMGGHMQSEKHHAPIEQLDALCACGRLCRCCTTSLAKPPPHAAHPPYSAPPPYAAEPSHVASPQPLFHFLILMCCTPSTTPRAFHLLNSHQVLRHQPFQIFLLQILPIQTCILCKRTTFSLVLVENNTWCSMVGCTHMSRF